MGLLTRHLNILLFFVLYSLAYTASAANTTMPNVLGMTLKEAEQRLTQQGLSVGSTENQRTNRKTGTIIVQAPKPGRSIPKGQAVRLVIAIPLVKPKTTTVPYLKGMTLEAAKAKIAESNLKLGKIKKRVMKVENEAVIYQSPKPGKGLIINSKVDVTLSTPANTGEPKVYIQLDKPKYGKGDTALISLSLRNIDPNRSGEYGFSINGHTKYTKSPSFRYTFPKSGRYVITASFRYTRGVWYPSLGKTIHVSSQSQKQESGNNRPVTPETKEKETPATPKTTIPTEALPSTATLVTTPNVVGLTEKKAKSLIRESGLRVGKVETREDKSGKIRILQQRPRADKKVEKGSRVNLIKSVPVKVKEWIQPVATIKPKEITVSIGETVRFYNRSTHDKNTRLKYQWTSSFGGESTNSRRFKIKTGDMSAGRYWVVLKVTDSKKNTSYARARLNIKETENTEEPATAEKTEQLTETKKLEIIEPQDQSDDGIQTKQEPDSNTTSNTSDDGSVIITEQNDITGNTPPANLSLDPNKSPDQTTKSQSSIKQIENEDHTFSVQIPVDKDSRDIAPWNLQLMKELSGEGNESKDSKIPPNSGLDIPTEPLQDQVSNNGLAETSSDQSNSLALEAPNTATNQTANLEESESSENITPSTQDTIDNDIILQESLQTESIANTNNTITNQNNVLEKASTTQSNASLSSVAQYGKLKVRESSSNWLIWIWGLLSVLILTILLFFLWKYRKSHHQSALIIDYQHQNDMGIQEFILDEDDDAPADSLHVSSQRDNGQQDFSLDSKKH